MSAKKKKYKDILFEVKDQVAWITINRPRVMNAFREQSLDEMIEAVKSTREDPSIACIVFQGAGNQAFSAGGDFYAMKRLNFTNGAMWNDRMLGLAMAIRGVAIPVIAKVNGWCMGGGHELALWCDLVIASEKSMLGQTGAKGETGKNFRVTDGVAGEFVAERPEALEDRNWSEEWQAAWEPISVGERFFLCPAWVEAPMALLLPPLARLFTARMPALTVVMPV